MHTSNTPYLHYSKSPKTSVVSIFPTHPYRSSELWTRVGGQHWGLGGRNLEDKDDAGRLLGHPSGDRYEYSKVSRESNFVIRWLPFDFQAKASKKN